MAVYFIADIKVNDPEAYKIYAEGIPAIVWKYRGRHLVRGGRVEQIESNGDTQRIIIMAFRNSAEAKSLQCLPNMSRWRKFATRRMSRKWVWFTKVAYLSEDPWVGAISRRSLTPPFQMALSMVIGNRSGATLGNDENQAF